MSVKSIRSNFALTVVICLGVATLGFCSIIPLASSVTNVVVHPLSVKGLSSTTWAVSNVERSSFADCGVANDVNRMADGKIVGGVETAPNEFPWQAYLQVEMESGKIYSCTGSLVSERWILTAAACATVPNEKTKSILVYLGLHNRSSSSTETTWKMYEGQGLLLHSGWDPNQFDNNIALVYLYTAVTFTQYIRPVCLAAPNGPSYAGDYATVAGWGRTSDGSTSSSQVLRKVTVPVISNSLCQSYYSVPITESMMCTSGGNSNGICGGDNGGPLNLKQPDGTWKQIGIASFWSAAGCQMGYPSGYTRLSSYSTWVQQIIAPGSDFSTTPLMIRTTLTTTIKTTPTGTPTTTQTISQSTSTKSPTTTTTETTTEKTTTTTTEATTTTSTEASITNPPVTFSCAVKANGNYPNPESRCSNTFYTCSNGNAYLFNCASTLVYREEIDVCDYPSNVAGCY
ncbi:chymotrypsin-like protease CTRL-1 [Daphnia pulicaria]|uniref:chymotrypsin-like protease CTRL-1 n=1 Tax=Daphnia pulicaria TaxID=35523 RepID=UPI001EEBB3DF|nr:chymotrypsin-like protease CTRL-1 [Daphnia pulicaria]